MKTDFGERFSRVYPSAESIEHLKARLLTKLTGFNPVDIVNGYEQLIETKPAYVPSVPEIAEAVREEKTARIRREQAQSEVARLSALPPPKAPPDSVAKENLRQIRELLGNAAAKIDRRETETERQDRLVRLETKRRGHEAMLAACFAQPYVEAAQQCKVGWCTKPGTLSASTKGSENWFCAEHFKGRN